MNNTTSSIITIGREYGSAGRQIGQEVARYFGIKCYDKELLEHAANDSGICKELFENHDERPTNSFLYSLVMDTYSFGYSSAGFTDMPMNHKVFLAQFEAIKKLAAEGPCVMVGLLLIHDTMPGASGYEWSRVEDQLAQEHTVYTLDLLGCGRSEKAGITYTNFLFVQIICDFIKNVIKEKTDIIASGFSCSFVTTAAAYDKESINKIMFINPVSMISLAQTTTKKDKLFKFFIELPIFGTFIYHIIVSRETINDFFLDKLYYNPFHVDKDVLDAYYEAAHKGGYYAKCLYSSQSAKYMNINIRHAVESIDNSIYIVEGEDEPNGAAIVEAYQKVNPAIESATIPCSKHFPHIENVEAFLEQVGAFF